MIIQLNKWINYIKTRLYIFSNSNVIKSSFGFIRVRRFVDFNVVNQRCERSKATLDPWPRRKWKSILNVAFVIKRYLRVRFPHPLRNAISIFNNTIKLSQVQSAHAVKQFTIAAYDCTIVLTIKLSSISWIVNYNRKLFKRLDTTNCLDVRY